MVMERGATLTNNSRETRTKPSLATETETELVGDGRSGVCGVDEFIDGGFMGDGDGEGSDLDQDLSRDSGEAEFDYGDGDSIEAAKDPVTKDNKRLKGEVSTHKSQLEALKAKDPEFYAYLQQTDAGLLGFGGGDDDESEEEDDEEEVVDEYEDEDEAPKKSKKQKKQDVDVEEEEEEGGRSAKGALNVTTALVNKWCGVAKESAPIGTVGQLVKAYRLACHYGDPEEEAIESSLRITSSSVYNQLMLFMLQEADGIFRRMLGIDKKAAGAITMDDLTKNGANWRKVIKSFWGNSMHLLASMTDPKLMAFTLHRLRSFWGNSMHLLASMTDPKLMAFTLRRLRASTSLLLPFNKHSDRMLKACLGIFGSAEVAPRLQAFLTIRAMALGLPPPFIEKCLKVAPRLQTFLTIRAMALGLPPPFIEKCLKSMYLSTLYRLTSHGVPLSSPAAEHVPSHLYRATIHVPPITPAEPMYLSPVK
eukprot:gene22463-29579_t